MREGRNLSEAKHRRSQVLSSGIVIWPVPSRLSDYLGHVLLCSHLHQLLSCHPASAYCTLSSLFERVVRDTRGAGCLALTSAVGHDSLLTTDCSRAVIGPLGSVIIAPISNDISLLHVDHTSPIPTDLPDQTEGDARRPLHLHHALDVENCLFPRLISDQTNNKKPSFPRRPRA